MLLHFVALPGRSDWLTKDWARKLHVRFTLPDRDVFQWGETTNPVDTTRSETPHWRGRHIGIYTSAVPDACPVTADTPSS